jgi:predicted RNA-binding protein YlxR (DUF448 family)
MARSTIQRRPPTRTCVSCRTEREKGDLVRIVRTQTGQNAQNVQNVQNVEVRVDPTGKAPGRGAYLCAEAACWSKALKTRAVQRALDVSSAPGLTALLSSGPPAGARQRADASTSGATHGA